MPGAPSSFLLLVVRPGAPSSVLPTRSFLFLVVVPGATSSVLAPGSHALVATSDGLQSNSGGLQPLCLPNLHELATQSAFSAPGLPNTHPVGTSALPKYPLDSQHNPLLYTHVRCIGRRTNKRCLTRQKELLVHDLVVVEGEMLSASWICFISLVFGHSIVFVNVEECNAQVCGRVVC